MTEEIDLLARIRRLRQQLVESGPTDERSDRDFERVALPHALSDAVRDLLVPERSRVVIEVGLAYGSSALAIGEALASQPDAQHIVIDPFQDHFKNVGWQAIQDAGMDAMSTLLAERSQTALPRLLSQGFVADAAFVDGSHLFHNVFVDLFFLQEIVRPGGLVILDDCEWPSVATALNYYELNVDWRPQPGGLPPRLRAFRLPDRPIEASFEDFQPFGLSA